MNEKNSPKVDLMISLKLIEFSSFFYYYGMQTA